MMKRMKKVVLGIVFLACAGMSALGNPVVGVVEICSSNKYSSVGGAYVKIVEEAGGVPLLLPASTNAETIAVLLDRVDMLLFCGGEDVVSERYGEKPSPKLGKVNVFRDEWELTLFKAATARRIPLVGICRGCQVINIGFGGTLWQDLPSEYEGGPVHRLKGEHGMTTEPGSYMAKLYGATTTVNSRHHQAVKRVGTGLKVTARSPEGVVEAFEGIDYPVIGVQFHPEKMFEATGRREFLPVFQDHFKKNYPVRSKVARKMKLCALPECCPTNTSVIMVRKLTEALELAGFASVVAPFTKNDALLEQMLDKSDALMVAGGTGKLQNYAKRCAFEHRAIRLALARGVPVSGICHGSQVLNTYFGGTLDSTPQAKGAPNPQVVHRRPPTEPYQDNFHMADLVAGSWIAGVMGELHTKINSSHSRCSCQMGTGLKVTARAPDGVVEAFEHETLPVMAFQFHPERLTFDARFVELLKAALSPRVERP